jgi:dUTP pyrophosphatase
MSDTTPAVIFEALFPDVVPPARATQGAAGYDVRAYLADRTVRTMHGGVAGTIAVGDEGHVVLSPGTTALVPLGFKARLPDGYEAQVRVRSSVAFRKGLVIPNAPGTIDADYPDEWLVMLRNDSAVAVTVEHGERIAQVVLNRFAVLPWYAGLVGISSDRTGGVGSTGRN